jgi:hypothetical protein
MHNVPGLVSGRERCVLYVHPEDADRYGVRDGGKAILESRVHRGEVRVAVTDEMRPGVVSLPHGWGHEDSAPWQKVAGSHAGVSISDWVDVPWSTIIGQSILNGVPVRLEPLRRAAWCRVEPAVRTHRNVSGHDERRAPSTKPPPCGDRGRRRGGSRESAPGLWGRGELHDLRRPLADAGDAPLRDIERQHIVATLKRAGWRIEGPNGAARLLSMNPSTLRSRMQKLGIRRSADGA